MLSRALGDDPGRVATVLDEFLDLAPRWMAQIERSVREDDAASGWGAAIRLAGASEMIGATDLADRAARLEHALHVGDPMVGDLVGATQATLGEVVDGLTERRAGGWPEA